MRESQDIPCTMAMTCHLRAGRLFTTVNMRSNNALRLLPYNLFEFTMLAELIAAELNVELGPYWHAVSSLHVFESELDPAVSIYSSPEDPAAEAKRMVEMPRGRGIFEEAAALVESEARLRANVVARDWASLAELVKQAEEELPPYWFGLFSVLALFSAARANALDEIDADLLRDSLPAALRGPLLALLA